MSPTLIIQSTLWATAGVCLLAYMVRPVLTMARLALGALLDLVKR